MISKVILDIAPAAMIQCLKKSPAEIEFFLAGAATADIGGYAICDAIHVGMCEIDVAMAGRD